jgi:DNA-binding transcriptional ArsR family regulator
LPDNRDDRDAGERLAELEAVMSALAHASRRHIMMVVRFRGGQMTAGEIASRFHHKWPTISRHLKVLVGAGLLVAEKHGRARVYRVDPGKLDVVREWLEWFARADDPHAPDKGLPHHVAKPHPETR